jgi:hypothetical protein
LTNGGDRFGELYRRLSIEEKPLSEMSIGIEADTYGEKIVERIAVCANNRIGIEGTVLAAQNYQRSQILTAELDVDLIASYFPVSLLLQTKAHYQQLNTADMYQSWGKLGDAFNYPAPQLVLAGGMFLTRQAKATDLIIDVGLYLHTVELLIRTLRPEWESIERYFTQLTSNDVAAKQAAAWGIAEACQVVGKKSKLVKNGDLVTANAIAEILSQVAIEMVTALIPLESPQHQECVKQIDDWGWAKLLESVRSTSVNIACELFTD